MTEYSELVCGLGVWTPLYIMYPEADIPVISLSVHSELDAQMHITAGELPYAT